MRRSNHSARLAFAVMVIALAGEFAPSRATAAEEKNEPAKISVDGLGVFRDLELRLALKRLLGTELKSSLDANAIEDAAVILVSSLGQEGFQNPEVEMHLILSDGTKSTFTFD